MKISEKKFTSFMSVSSVTLNLESRLEAYNLKVVDLIVALNLESKSRFCDIKIILRYCFYRVEYFSKPDTQKSKRDPGKW